MTGTPAGSTSTGAPASPDARSRVALVTGGARGLGLEIGRVLHAAGMRVALVDRDDAAVQAAAGALAGGRVQQPSPGVQQPSPGVQQPGPGVQQPGPPVLGLRCDVARLDEIEATIARIAQSLGEPYALVNCAGVAEMVPVLEITPESWNRTLAVNVSGSFWFAQVAARRMIAARAGRIVNIASISGERAGFGRAAYGTSKAAVIQLTRQLALELGPYGITANAVGPGPVETEMTLRNHTPEMRADYNRTIPLARYGTPTEIAEAVAFLCSDAAAYINGQTLFVDGGFTAVGNGVEIAQARARRRPG